MAKHKQDINNTESSLTTLYFKFKIAINNGNKLPFLDVMVDNNSVNLKLKIYGKPTYSGQCLHNKSECPRDTKSRSYLAMYDVHINLLVL